MAACLTSAPFVEIWRLEKRRNALFIDFELYKDVHPEIMLRELLQNYVAVTSKLDSLPLNKVVPAMKPTLADLRPTEAKALLEE